MLALPTTIDASVANSDSALREETSVEPSSSENATSRLQQVSLAFFDEVGPFKEAIIGAIASIAAKEQGILPKMASTKFDQLLLDDRETRLSQVCTSSTTNDLVGVLLAIPEQIPDTIMCGALTAHVKRLAVQPTMRGKGVATLLLHRLAIAILRTNDRTESQESRIRWIYLTTWVRNQTGLRLYIKCGFAPVAYGKAPEEFDFEPYVGLATAPQALERITASLLSTLKINCL